MRERGLLALKRQRLGFGRGDFALHAYHIQFRRIARAVAALDEAQRVAIGGQALLHELALGLQRAQLQVGLRHIGLHHQPRALQQGGLRLGVLARGLAGIRETAEQIDLIGQVQARREQRGGLRAIGGIGASLPCRPRGGTELRHALRIGRAQQRARLGQACGGGLHIGVGDGRALDQRRQFGVRECAPPLAARLGLGRRRRGPGGLFLRRAERGRRLHARQRFGRRQRGRAAREQQGGGERSQCHAAPRVLHGLHGVLPVHGCFLHSS